MSHPWAEIFTNQPIIDHNQEKMTRAQIVMAANMHCQHLKDTSNLLSATSIFAGPLFTNLIPDAPLLGGLLVPAFTGVMGLVAHDNFQTCVKNTMDDLSHNS
jgi:hypothetical protein